ncbi:hypothetical protein EW145_g1161 [Phellinidium pouzarii]|uniref:Uncharacterized protein n=1 Tax=Phellinidium pouzarii TaxID=167371 RepID=A0A4S4LHB6_9AGAM|nr:hypothetical protein EW145_g1161 [Phellinidium pouzarii]
MKKILRYLVFSAISILLVVVFSSVFYGNNGLRSDGIQFGLKNRPPKITVIAVWTPRGPSPIYMPYFFQSVEANPQVDLLFIQVNKHHACSSYSSAPNVQELCLTEDQYVQLHVDFLCKRWKCTNQNKAILFARVKQADPATTIWGWCDVDAFWGNFTRTFPWDVAHDFDVLSPASQPDFSNKKLLFQRGHMAFFRHSPEVLDKLHSFPKFSSFSAYLTLPGTLYDAEESEFSHYIFSEEESFTFLAFEGMLHSWDTVMLSEKGVFYSPKLQKDISPERRSLLLSLARPKDKAQIRPTFSPDGVEQNTRFFRDGYEYGGSLWFDMKYATFVETGWIEPKEREQKGYIMRREPHGPVLQRLEPRERHLVRYDELVVDECLYKHWQVEKHEAWFKKIPEGGLAAGETFVQHRNAEAEIWVESGDVVYATEP